MREFKRTTTLFTGGEVRISSGNARDGFFPQQSVTIIRAVPDHGDEEDRFEVEFRNAGRAIVDGCDLHPHPESPATNVELLTHMCNNGSTAMVQAFIMDAIGKVAAAVIADADNVKAKMEGGMISGDLWVDTAKEIKAQLESRS
jgi:hypothetical protein